MLSPARHDLHVCAAPNSRLLLCDCREPSLLTLGVNKEGRLYFNCGLKDPRNLFAGGCGFFNWQTDFSAKHGDPDTKPIIVSVHPSVWRWMNTHLPGGPQVERPLANLMSGMSITSSDSLGKRQDTNVIMPTDSPRLLKTQAPQHPPLTKPKTDASAVPEACPLSSSKSPGARQAVLQVPAQQLLILQDMIGAILASEGK